MAINGTPKEMKTYKKYVGLFTANVVAVNPTKSELEKLLGTNIDKDPEYTGTNNEGNKRITLSFWLKEANLGVLFNVRFNLEDKIMISSTGKTQFINSAGQTSYAQDKSQVPDFLTEGGRSIKPAKKGEELLCKFLRKWLNNLPYDDPNTEIVIDDWKALFNGNTKELKSAIDAYKSQEVGAMATIRTSDDGKEYQSVYSYEFLPSFAIRSLFENGKAYKTYDAFVEKVNDEKYGCKDHYELGPLKEYDPTLNVVNTSNSSILPKAKTKAPTIDSTVVDDLPF
jgi:hypothetical protein